MECGEQYLRSEANYVNNSNRFLLKGKVYKRQYAHIYYSRLETMKPKVQAAASEKWGRQIPCKELSELGLDERCVLIGTLYKHMSLKPSILKEIGEEHNLMPPPIRDKYADPTDSLVLEGDLQRIVLTGNIDAQVEVTGSVVAVLGEERSECRGKFFVEDVLYYPVPSQVSRKSLDKDKYVVFVSGLDVGDPSADMLRLQLFVDLITGQLGDEPTQKLMANVVRVVIAGNSLSQVTQDKEQANRARYLSKKMTPGTKDAIVKLDDILLQLSSCVQVDLMPGELDPTTFILPQQPLHRCMLPQASRLESLHCVTNPYDFSVDGVNIVGSSGQPVHDIYKFSAFDDHLKILEKTLMVGHIAPTAPDTLGCYPYFEEEPFILSQCPDIYFTGNAPEFASKIHNGPRGQKILLLTIPKFSTTSTCALVNLRTFQCRPISIGATSVNGHC